MMLNVKLIWGGLVWSWIQMFKKKKFLNLVSRKWKVDITVGKPGFLWHHISVQLWYLKINCIIVFHDWTNVIFVHLHLDFQLNVAFILSSILIFKWVKYSQVYSSSLHCWDTLIILNNRHLLFNGWKASE